MNNQNKSSWNGRLQKFGNFLSGMIMPNIGAFIAWGLLTALFLDTGWIPNENLITIHPLMLNYALPILIAHTGGGRVHGGRGSVIGVIATMGAIASVDVPMFLGAMILGPLAAWILKKVDEWVTPKLKAGFEMLINNFSLGIVGLILAILAYISVGPLMGGLSTAMASAVDFLVNKSLLPLVAIIAEPAKVLFLNNALDHGIINPIAIQQVAEAGKSYLFLIIQNPGPGLGVLLAYTFFGAKRERQSAPGAIIIHFLGGIHEIYFPYILMNPLVLIPTILAGIAGLFTFGLLGAGMVAPASPGSIFAILAMTERSSYLGVIVGIAVSTLVAFAGTIPLLRFSKTVEETNPDKKIESNNESVMREENDNEAIVNEISKLPKNVKVINFACDAGMGSSAMGASILRNKFKENNINIEVTNSSIYDIPENVDIVITQDGLLKNVMNDNNDINFFVTVDDFLTSPRYGELIDYYKA